MQRAVFAIGGFKLRKFHADYQWLSVCHEAESWDRADSRIVEPRDRVQLWFNLEVAKYLNLDTIQAHAEQRKNIGVGFEFIIPLCWIRIVSRLL
jgi:hypothetical protein